MEVTMEFLNKLSLLLAIIGWLNCGGIGLFSCDVVACRWGGPASLLSRIIYTLVGLAGIWCITLLFHGEEGPAPHTT